MSSDWGQPTYINLGRDEVERLAQAMEGEAWLKKLRSNNQFERYRGEAEGARFTLWFSGKMSYQGPKARAVLEELVKQAGLGGEGGPTEVGSDEAGKGEWLGPLVVAAVAVRPDQRLALRLDGVRDSKDLGGELRQTLAERIRRDASAVRVVMVGALKFNELWESMHARGETLNDLLWWAHKKAVEPVLEFVENDAAVRVVLDEFDRTRRAEDQYRAFLPQHAEVDQRPRAEAALAVAAASVLARAERDKQVALASERLGLDLLNLSPAQARAHPKAKEFAKVAYLKEKPV